MESSGSAVAYGTAKETGDSNCLESSSPQGFGGSNPSGSARKSICPYCGSSIKSNRKDAWCTGPYCEWTIRTKSEGTCKQGERSDLTGCTPASGDASAKKPSQPEDHPKKQTRSQLLASVVEDVSDESITAAKTAISTLTGAFAEQRNTLYDLGVEQSDERYDKDIVAEAEKEKDFEKLESLIEDFIADINVDVDSVEELLDAIQEEYDEEGEVKEEILAEYKSKSESLSQALQSYSKNAVELIDDWHTNFIGERQRKKSEKQDEENEGTARQNVDALNENYEEDPEGALDDAAIYNQELTDADNPYRVVLDDDNEMWVYGYADDLETWPGKKDKSLIVLPRIYNIPTKRIKALSAINETSGGSLRSLRRRNIKTPRIKTSSSFASRNASKSITLWISRDGMVWVIEQYNTQEEAARDATDLIRQGYEVLSHSPEKNIKQKGMFSTVQSAGRWLADKWASLENRYGRAGALSMAVASLISFPIPFNITAIIAAAEAIRGVSARIGNIAPSFDVVKCMEGTPKPGPCPRGGSKPSKQPAKAPKKPTQAKPSTRRAVTKPKLKPHTIKPRVAKETDVPDYVKDPIVFGTQVDDSKFVEAKRFAKSLTKKEVDAVRFYTEEGHIQINKEMRSCPPKFTCVSLKKEVSALSSLIDRAPPLPEGSVLFRGLGGPPSQMKKLIEAAKKTQKNGGGSFQCLLLLPRP